jgi:hypothetical protein
MKTAHTLKEAHLPSIASAILLLALAAVLPSPATAGLVINAAGNAVHSDTPGRHVLTCRKISGNPEYCQAFFVGNTLVTLTPHQYAGHMGYKVVHAIGAMVQDGNEYYVLEVSK